MPAKRKSTKQRIAPGQRAKTLAWQDVFIAQLRINGNINRSCQMAGIERSTAYRSRAADKNFLARWEDALEVAIDRLEEEAYRRAHQGTTKAVFYKGAVVGFENEYSDTLMTLLLKANRPDKFADKLIIKVSPEDAAILKEMGKSPGDAFEELMNKIKAAKCSVP